jgi:hypothetical protein
MAEGRALGAAEGPENLTVPQQVKLAEVQAANRSLYRAYLLKEEVRALYHLPDRSLAAEQLDAWLAWVSRSKLKPFVRLARTIRHYRDGILAAIPLGLSNARLEGLNSKVRLISHRGFGFHTTDPLIALIYRCAGGISSTRRSPPTREENQFFPDPLAEVMLEDPRLSSDSDTGCHEKVVMWSYPIIKAGLIYVIDLRKRPVRSQVHGRLREGDQQDHVPRGQLQPGLRALLRAGGPAPGYCS